MGDSIKLGKAFRMRTGGEGCLRAVVVMTYHGGLGGMGIKNAMVNVVSCFDKTGGQVGLVLKFT